MKFTSPLHNLHKQTDYSSIVWINSLAHENVRYAVRRISLLQRIEMAERIYQLTAKYEFLKAGDSLQKTESHLADLLVKKLYLEWGIAAIEGLAIDGQKASIEQLIESGPESLCDEMASSVRAQFELSEEERKNY